MNPPVGSSGRVVWLAGVVPKNKWKRKSGVSRTGADLAFLHKLMADAGRDMVVGMFDEPTREVPERRGASE